MLIYWSKGQLSRDTFVQGSDVQGTVVQVDFGSRRILSKEAFPSDKLAQIIVKLETQA